MRVARTHDEREWLNQEDREKEVSRNRIDGSWAEGPPDVMHGRSV
jgi:hypothetical protein